MMFRFEGEAVGVLAARGIRAVAALAGEAMGRGVLIRRDDGGWFSASEDCGEGEGVTPFGGGVGGVGSLIMAGFCFCFEPVAAGFFALTVRFLGAGLGATAGAGSSLDFFSTAISAVASASADMPGRSASTTTIGVV